MYYLGTEWYLVSLESQSCFTSFFVVYLHSAWNWLIHLVKRTFHLKVGFWSGVRYRALASSKELLFFGGGRVAVPQDASPVFGTRAAVGVAPSFFYETTCSIKEPHAPPQTKTTFEKSCRLTPTNETMA